MRYHSVQVSCESAVNAEVVDIKGLKVENQEKPVPKSSTENSSVLARREKSCSSIIGGGITASDWQTQCTYGTFAKLFKNIMNGPSGCIP